MSEVCRCGHGRGAHLHDWGEGRATYCALCDDCQRWRRSRDRGPVMTWRTWLGFCGTGCAAVLAYRGHWVLTGVAAGVVLVPVGLWFRDEMAGMKALYREGMQEAPEPPPPALEPFPAPRIRREPHPPWDTAQQPVVPAEPVSDDLDAGRHRKRRELKETLADAVRKAARVPLP